MCVGGSIRLAKAVIASFAAAELKPELFQRTCVSPTRMYINTTRYRMSIA